MRIVSLMTTAMKRCILHCLVLRPHQIRLTLLLLLLLLLLLCLRRLDERLGGGEAVSGRVKAHIHFVVGHREVRKVHLYHVVAKTAFLRKHAYFILIFLFQSLHFLLHLLQSQVKLFV